MNLSIGFNLVGNQLTCNGALAGSLVKKDISVVHASLNDEKYIFKFNSFGQGYSITSLNGVREVAKLDYNWREGPPEIHTNNPKENYDFERGILRTGSTKFGKVTHVENVILAEILESILPTNQVPLAFLMILDTMYAERIGFFPRGGA